MQLAMMSTAERVLLVTLYAMHRAEQFGWLNAPKGHLITETGLRQARHMLGDGWRPSPKQLEWALRSLHNSGQMILQDAKVEDFVVLCESAICS